MIIDGTMIVRSRIGESELNAILTVAVWLVFPSDILQGPSMKGVFIRVNGSTASEKLRVYCNISKEYTVNTHFIKSAQLELEMEALL